MPESGAPQVATLGEALVVLDATETGALRHVGTLRKGVGGAELNVAVALSRLGQTSVWAGSLGDDEFGEEILSFLRAEGVDVSRAQRDMRAPTGVYFKERRSLGDTRVLYYRSGSAASRQDFEDLDVQYLLSSDVLHLTGITPLLSESCQKMCLSLIKQARERDVIVSFDANVRHALLGDRDPVELILPFIELADIVFLSDAEAKLLLGGDDEETVSKYSRARPGLTLVVHSAEGAYAAEGNDLVRASSYVVEAIDSVGAGDAFVAGFLAALLRDMDLKKRLEMANACGACAVTVFGDARSMPFADDVSSLLKGDGPRER